MVSFGKLAISARRRFRASTSLDVRRAPDLLDVALEKPKDAIDTAFPDEDLATVKSGQSLAQHRCHSV
jgi:hypothetical protein